MSNIKFPCFQCKEDFPEKELTPVVGGQYVCHPCGELLPDINKIADYRSKIYPNEGLPD